MIEEIIRSIRTDLRLAMNGVVSTSMRKKGMDYKMNFGVDEPRLNQIAQKYEPDATLAKELWKLDVRELKILSTLLYPVNDFTKCDANEWVNSVATHEIREYWCRNLLQKLTFADQLVHDWLANQSSAVRISGYWLFARLMLIQSNVLRKVDLNVVIEKALVDILADDFLLHAAALNALKLIVRRDEESAVIVMNKISAYEESDDALEKEIYDNLYFEYKIRG